MSRIGKKPIAMPKGVTVKVRRRRGRSAGPEGQAAAGVPAGINFALADGTPASRSARPTTRSSRKFHGLARSLVANAVTGVTDGFKRSSTSSASATARS